MRSAELYRTLACGARKRQCWYGMTSCGGTASPVLGLSVASISRRVKAADRAASLSAGYSGHSGRVGKARRRQGRRLHAGRKRGAGREVVRVGRRRFLTTILALYVLGEKRELLAKMLLVKRKAFPQPSGGQISRPPHGSVTDYQNRYSRRPSLLPMVELPAVPIAGRL